MYKRQEQPDTTWYLKRIFEAKGIPVWVDLWGHDVKHDWDWWYKPVSYTHLTVLKDVSFTAKQGEVTALVGPSGGDKTTVSRLAARFWDNQKGCITVGGMDISKIDPEKLMSLVTNYMLLEETL